MNEKMYFDFYYGQEAEQFSFLRIPKVLFTDERFKNLSVDSKVLYGLLLDRLSLSIKNRWLDSENRVYIYYTLDNIMEDLHCSSGKCIKLLKELDTKTGIGLIGRKKQGLGKPDIIYVKNFLKEIPGLSENNMDSAQIPDMQNLQLKGSENGKSGHSNSASPDLQKQTANNTKYTKNEANDHNPINPSRNNPHKGSPQMDAVDRINAYRQIIAKNIEYDLYMKDESSKNRELYHELYILICDTVCSKRISIRIGGEDHPYEEVKARLLKLDSRHLHYVMECLKSTTTDIRNIKSYLLTALYFAPSTINTYWMQRVRHDQI